MLKFSFKLDSDDSLLLGYSKKSLPQQREKLAAEFLAACDIEFYPDEGRGEEDYHLVLRDGGTVAKLKVKA
ncbi:hypothetical protein KC902_04270 [Candidatus Kaiserbacteria bacterium]|nr:hypothetical protein [Candidatus Kaiserbacteria bacterium]USN88697.1 MAG: hypothetical protein H6780_04395 [Candidatus Nomurabacteria bacterium]